MKNERINYYDTMKSAAVIFVFVTHFISIACPTVFSLWKSGITSYFLTGISGKLGVSIFCVLLGYFSARSKKDLVEYVTMRFIQFSIPPMIVYFFIYFEFKLGSLISYHFARPSIFASFEGLNMFKALRRILANTLFLRPNILATFWCFSIFFIASILIGICSRIFKNKNKLHELIVSVIVLALLLLSSEVWLAICWMGYIVKLIQDMNFKLMKATWVNIILILCALILYRQPKESDLTYILQGTSAALFTLSLSQLSFVAKILSYKPLGYLGQKGLQIYIWHIPVIIFMYEIVIHFASSLESPLVVFILFILAATTTLLIASISDKLYARFETQCHLVNQFQIKIQWFSFRESHCFFSSKT